MRIKFYGPFNERIGKNEVEFSIEGEITLSQFSKRLVDRFPVLREFLTGNRSFEILNSIFFVARKGAILGPEDTVKDEDEIEIMAPVDGG